MKTVYIFFIILSLCLLFLVSSESYKQNWPVVWNLDWNGGHGLDRFKIMDEKLPIM